MFTKGCMASFIFLMLFQNIAMCQQLKVGDKAPDFKVIDTNGNSIKLSQYKGQKVLITFFRYASCPIYNFRVHELIENYDSISSKGYKIIAIYESSNATWKMLGSAFKKQPKEAMKKGNKFSKKTNEMET